MTVALPIDEFLARAREWPVLDVRTPAEFADGHLPGARNLPLFADDERAAIGTCYAHHGRAAAVRVGLEHIAPRITGLAEELLEIAAPANGKLLIHCWRGGMRSGSVAWLASTLGCRVATLAGGYKAFRRKVLESFTIERAVRVVAGLTGTGKTEVLQALGRQGAQVIDLEALARHKGSAFGDLGEAAQPTQEQFENDLAMAWLALDPARPVWLEDESQMIGKLVVPPPIWNRKRAGHFAVIELPDEARIARLREVYAGFPLAQLESRLEAIRRRLGGDRTNQALAALRTGDTTTACRLMLHYYDRTYRTALTGIPAERMTVYSFDRCDPAVVATAMLQTKPATPLPNRS